MTDFNETLHKAEVEFNRALCQAQKDAKGGPKLDQSFDADGRNTGKSFSFKYTSAQFMCEWARGILNSHGLTVSRSGRTTTSQEQSLLIINVPFRIRHVAGHSDEFSVAYPVTIPAGGTIVRGCTASHTTLLKTALMDVLSVRGDDDARDEEYHREVVPAGLSLPVPIGLPDTPGYFTLPNAPASSVANHETTAAPVQQQRTSEVTVSGPAPSVSVANVKPLAEAATQSSPVEGLNRLVAACKRTGDKALAALCGVNGNLALAGRPPLVSEAGAMLRDLAPADYAPIAGYAYEVEAHLGGNGVQAAASGSAPPAAPAAQASPSATPASSSAPGVTEPNAANDQVLKARLDTFFERAKAARERKKEDRVEFVKKANAAVGHVVIEDGGHDPAKYTATAVDRLEGFLLEYAK